MHRPEEITKKVYTNIMNLIRDDTHMTSMKIGQFSRPSPPLSSYAATSRILPPAWPWTSNFKQTATPSPNYNQSIKRKHGPSTKDDYFMLLGLSFRSTFVLSISSLILSGFPLTFIHLAEAKLVPRAILKN